MNVHARKLFATGAILGSAALIAAGCGDDSSSSSNNGNASGDRQSETSETSSAKDDAKSGADLTSSEASDTLIKLDSLLAEHAILAQLATQKGFAGKKDFEAVGAALDQNSVELSQLIGSVYGDEAEEKFLDGKDQWRDHIKYFVNYTVGLAKKDKAMQNKAVADLGRYNKAFPAFIAPAVGLPTEPVVADISTHIGDLKTQIDQFAAGDYEQAYTTFVKSTDHMYMTGEVLGGAIVEQQDIDNGSATADGVALRVTLNRLLSEHAALAMAATQKGYDGDKDFAAIGAELDKNSVALSEAIASVYGEEAGKQFLDGKDMWRDHIKYFVNYTVGLAKKDKAMQDKAVADLGRYTETFSAFIAGATGMPEEVVVEDISAHVGQLKQQIDSYAAGDYEQAWDDYRKAYAHMFMTGDALAEAITAQNPDKFGGESSGGGGGASKTETHSDM